MHALDVRFVADADLPIRRYWDWASDDTQSRMPSVVTQQSISVTRPGAGGAAETAEIPNPLYSYRFLEPQAPGSVSKPPTELEGIVSIQTVG